MIAVPAPPGTAQAQPVPPARVQHQFDSDGEAWTARAAGAGAAGTGGLALAYIEAIHFYRAGEERPAFEALLALGRFDHLQEPELVALLRGATRIPPER